MTSGKGVGEWVAEPTTVGVLTDLLGGAADRLVIIVENDADLVH